MSEAAILVSYLELSIKALRGRELWDHFEEPFLHMFKLSKDTPDLSDAG